MSALRIALDANEANVSQRVGSNIYAFKLLLELERQSREDEAFQFTVFLSAPPQADFPLQRAGWEYKVVTPKFLWTQWRFPLELLGNKHDLVFSLGHYAPRFSPIKRVICIMDLAFLRFPEFFRKKDLYQLREWTKYSVKKAKHIVTISQNSKLDIIKEYGRAPEEISIIYPGVELPESVENKEEVLGSFGLVKDRYLVCVGTIQPRKNLINLIKAFEKLEDKEVRLVFVGKSGWLTAEFDEAVAMSSAKDRIVVTGFVDEASKYTLIANSAGSILVGFYEGFGIPAIESMGMGVVPVVANTGSLPEVVDGLGIQVDPYSIDDIARGLSEVLMMRASREQTSKLQKRAADFTWQKSGAKLLEVLKNIQ